MVCAVRYEQRRHPPRPLGFGRVARYAWGKDYHLVLREKLQALGASLETLGIKSRGVTDSIPLLERPLAAKSGLGFIGKNSLFIIPKTGSLTLLGELLLDCNIVNTPKAPPSSGCGSCNKCKTSCPTQAIASDYVVDARRCISYLTIEKKGIFTIEERGMVGEWIFGCDECQEICPFNYTPIKIGGRPDVASFGSDYGVGSLVGLGELFMIREEEDFRRRFRHTPLSRPKREGLIRNGLCVAVNTGAHDLIPMVEECLSDPAPVIRATALWAISEFQKHGAGISRTYIRALDKLSIDKDPLVRAEARLL